MPLFCELDEVMITLQHGVLHRKQTIANGGEYCDYYITGNKEWSSIRSDIVLFRKIIKLPFKNSN